MSEQIQPASRVRQPSTGRTGRVVDVNRRKRPPAARVLFDGDSAIDAVWIPLDRLEAAT